MARHRVVQHASDKYPRQPTKSLNRKGGGSSTPPQAMKGLSGQIRGGPPSPQEARPAFPDTRHPWKTWQKRGNRAGGAKGKEVEVNYEPNPITTMPQAREGKSTRECPAAVRQDNPWQNCQRKMGNMLERQRQAECKRESKALMNFTQAESTSRRPGS